MAENSTTRPPARVIAFDMGSTLIGAHEYLNFVDSDDPSVALLPGALDLLRYIAEVLRVPIVIVSNTTIQPERILAAFKRLGFCHEQLHAGIFSSDPVVRRGKPHRRIYRVAYRVVRPLLQNGPRKQLVFVGDHYLNDVKRPKTLYGFDTVYLQDQDTHDESLGLAERERMQHATYIVGTIGAMKPRIHEILRRPAQAPMFRQLQARAMKPNSDNSRKQTPPGPARRRADDDAEVSTRSHVLEETVYM
jgi:hypothetical protein